jgi:diaminopimelate decarboxylase
LFIHLGADFFMRDAYTKARTFPLLAYSKRAELLQGPSAKFDLAGPLCFAGDYLAHGAELPGNINEGDWLVIDETGANTYALWSRHCSRTVPAVWAWDGENIARWSERKRIDF